MKSNKIIMTKEEVLEYNEIHSDELRESDGKYQSSLSRKNTKIYKTHSLFMDSINLLIEPFLRYEKSSLPLKHKIAIIKHRHFNTKRLFLTKNVNMFTLKELRIYIKFFYFSKNKTQLEIKKKSKIDNHLLENIVFKETSYFNIKHTFHERIKMIITQTRFINEIYKAIKERDVTYLVKKYAFKSKNVIKDSNLFYTKKFPILTDILIEQTSYLNKNAIIRQRFWHLMSNNIFTPICAECMKRLDFANYKLPYRRFCSPMCRAYNTKWNKEQMKEVIISKCMTSIKIPTEDIDFLWEYTISRKAVDDVSKILIKATTFIENQKSNDRYRLFHLK